MKKLFLVRHAKSDWAIPNLSDIDRPLNPRGYDDAHRMGAHLKSKINATTLLISSPAVRALTTALIFSKEMNYSKEKIRIIERLYEAKEEVFMDVISTLDESFNTVFIFGHNPTISEVVVSLTRSRTLELPTCSVSEIVLDGAWSDFLTSKPRLESQFSPKLLTI